MSATTQEQKKEFPLLAPGLYEVVIADAEVEYQKPSKWGPKDQLKLIFETVNESYTDGDQQKPFRFFHWYKIPKGLKFNGTDELVTTNIAKFLEVLVGTLPTPTGPDDVDFKALVGTYSRAMVGSKIAKNGKEYNNVMNNTFMAAEDKEQLAFNQQQKQFILKGA